MPEISITIKNIREIKRAFGMAPKLMTKNLSTAIAKSVLVIGRDSRRLTPVDTGRLRASHRDITRGLYGEVGTHTEYDIYVHEGTRYMRARPYLRMAVDKNSISVQGFFKQAVDSTLNTIGKMT